MSAPTILLMPASIVIVSEIPTMRKDVKRKSPANTRRNDQEISNMKNIFTID
jgi:hypothetical protein